MQDNRTPSPRQQAASRQISRSVRTRVRLFPDILVVVLALLVLFFAIKPNLTAPAAQQDDAGLTGLQVEGSTPILSELMALNKGAYTAGDGNYYDWIEIYNPTGENFNLEGYTLSDNIEKLDKYVFPATVLSPGAYLIVFASGLSEAPTQGELHAPFKLSSMGESVYLCDPYGNILDQITFDALGIDAVHARTGTQEWEQLTYYTPGYPNTKEGYAAYEKTRVAPASPVKLNEIMSSNSITIADEDGDYADWVELYNSSDEPINLYNYGLSDDTGRTKQWVFPDVTLQGGEYLMIYLSGKNRVDPAGNLHANFRLNSYEGTVLFSNPQGQIIEQVQVDNLATDTSYGRVEGTDQWQNYSHPTPGYPNTEEGFNALQPSMYADMTTPVIISEVMNNNQTFLKDDETGAYYNWVELYNRSGDTVSLNGWMLS
ncbi:MAG: lamin tail domain-containing protein, partial [Eubacteriales bacterium]|nr:lamin tail domain-containing protein [Eubacteriales bacterium]